MPKITTRGNITATAYGFGKVGGGALGSYFLTTIANTAGTNAFLASITKVSNSQIAFSADVPSTTLFYGVLTNTGTLNWSKNLSGSGSRVGYIGYDDNSKIYSFGSGNIESGYFDESNGSWASIGQTTGTGFLYNSLTGTVKPVGSYIYAVDKSYDSGFSWRGFGFLFQPIAGGSGDWKTVYTNASDTWTVYTTQITKYSSTTAYGIIGGSTGNSSRGTRFQVARFSGSSTPAFILTSGINNSNSSYIASNDAIVAAVVDSSGNSYVMAIFHYNASGTYGVFRSFYKINSSGTVLWARRLPNSGDSYNGKAVLDTLGNVYFAVPDSSKLFITKYTTSGTFVWDRTLNIGSANDSAYIDTDDASFWVGGSVSGGKSVILRAPADGSKTGTYGGYAYAVGQTSDSAFTDYQIGGVGNQSYSTFSTSTPSITASTYSPTIVKTTV